MTLLGTGTSMGVPMIGCQCDVCMSDDPHNQRTRTGVHISAPQGGVLIDTSPELRVQLIRERITSVDAVLYTHAHADHILGLDDLRVFGFKRKGPVPLYCEPPVEATLRQAFSYAFLEETKRDTWHSYPNLEFRTIGLEPIPLLGLTVHPIRLLHGRLPVLGFRIRNVAFCTDCSCIPDDSWPLLEGLDTLVLDALWKEPHPTHFNIAQALEVVSRVRPKETFLTHVSHRLDYSRTNAELPPGVRLSHDGQKIAIE
ncbi:MAG: MBL fold metallo-hydrolase [Planctomyces sp.]|nr:MBL fold metallo-hydrolase [Planctomyces sp.]